MSNLGNKFRNYFKTNWEFSKEGAFGAFLINQISPLILNKFKQTNRLIFPLKSSENLRL